MGWNDSIECNCVGCRAARREDDELVSAPISIQDTDICDLVLDDVSTRKRVGMERYGVPLRAHNGKDALREAYEEALDLVIYLRQIIHEIDNPVGGSDA